MSAGLAFSYGSYNFRPRPLMSIKSQPLKTPDGTGYGVVHNISLNGSVLLTGTQITSGILGVSNKIETLKDALDQDGRLLVVSCGDVPVVSGYPTMDGYSFDTVSDNMTRRATYSIEFTMPTTLLGSGNDNFNNGNSFPPFIESATESWDVEFADERTSFDWTLPDGTAEKFGYKLAVTHNVDVKARIAYTGDAVSNVPWKDARDYAIDRLGFDSEVVTLTGILGVPGTAYFSTRDVFNHYRQVSTNKSDGSIKVVETFVVTPEGADSLPNNAMETFDIGLNQSDGLTTVNINGNIEGLATISYTGDGGSQDGYNVSASKFSAASGYYNIIKDRLYDRAKGAYAAVSGACWNRPLSATIRQRAVGINPIEGTISYDYTFDTATTGCITGTCIISQSVTIDDQLDNEVIAEQVILGRAAGPIIQDIGTITARVRTVNVELVTLPPTDCSTVANMYAPVPTGAVDDFIAIISGDLWLSYGQVFVVGQNQTWDLTAGRYTKSKSFKYTNCSS